MKALLEKIKTMEEKELRTLRIKSVTSASKDKHIVIEAIDRRLTVDPNEGLLIEHSEIKPGDLV